MAEDGYQNVPGGMAQAAEYSALPGSRARRWLLAYPRAIPLAIFLAIVAATVLSVYAIESNVRAREDAQMNAYAEEVGSALEMRGNSFSSYLRAGAALFSSVEEVTPGVFRQFVSDLRLNVDYKGVEGIGWVESVPRTGETQFLERIRSMQPDYPAIYPRPGASLPPLAPVTFISPDTASNRQALGFNMASDPVRAAAMEQARRNVRPTATGKVELQPGSASQSSGFIVFMPVYNGDPGARDITSSLAGYVYAPFDADAFLSAAVESAGNRDFGVKLFDGSPDADSGLAIIPADGEVTRRVENRVTVADRELLLTIESTDRKDLSALSMATLIFGLCLASLLMLLARVLTQQAQEDRTRLAFLEEQHSIRNSLTRELNHRVKNTLANVLSIVSLTRRRASGLDDFADSLEGRIRSLSATHDLLTRTEWGTTPIEAVVDAELQHFRAASDNVVTTEGPDVELAPNDALSFGLALHELATNAAKFGALSSPDGCVTVKWNLVGKNLADVEWKETGGPAVEPARKRGFGTELIEKIVSHELKHAVQLDFEPDGVRCVMRVPVRQRVEFQIRSAPAGK